MAYQQSFFYQMVVSAVWSLSYVGLIIVFYLIYAHAISVKNMAEVRPA